MIADSWPLDVADDDAGRNRAYAGRFDLAATFFGSLLPRRRSHHPLTLGSDRAD